MNWRRWLGIDPAGKSGGVVVHQLLGGGEIRIDAEQLQRSMSLGGGRVPRTFADGTPMRSAVERWLAEYQPSDSKGKPLSNKDKTLHHGLHLDDYQPRSHEHGVQRVTFERAYPPLPEQDPGWTFIGMHRPSTEWVDYRNRSPLHSNTWLLPPMRDALADLIEHLHMVHTKLAEQDLVAVEVSVQHEPTPSKQDGSGQGWNFAVHAVAVPQAVLDDEQREFTSYVAKQTAPDGA